MPPVKPLSDLNTVDWASLTHAYGPAADVPEHIRSLLDSDDKVRKKAFWSLYGNIFHQGTRYQAAAYAVPFLLGILNDLQREDRAELVNLLLALAVGYFEELLPGPFDPKEFRRDMEKGNNSLTEAQRTENEEFGFSLIYLIDVYDAVLAGIPSLLPFLSDKDDRVREAVAHALAWFPEISHLSVPALWTALEAESNPSCAASIAFSLGFLLRGHENESELEAAFLPCLKSENMMERASAFLALASKPLPPDLQTIGIDMVRQADVLDAQYSGNVNEGSLGDYAALFVDAEHINKAIISGAPSDAERDAQPKPSSGLFRKIWMFLSR